MTATTTHHNAAKYEKTLVDELSAALLESEPTTAEPLRVESQIAGTKSAHIVVIWDKWNGMSPADRSKVILDAYKKAQRLMGDSITVAMGLNDEEALRMGFLPYSIIALRRPGDQPSLKRLEAALAQAGGVMLKVGSSTQLRFPNMYLAEEAYRKLSMEVPGPYWAIVREESASE